MSPRCKECNHWLTRRDSMKLELGPVCLNKRILKRVDELLERNSNGLYSVESEQFSPTVMV